MFTLYYPLLYIQVPSAPVIKSFTVMFKVYINSATDAVNVYRVQA